MKRKALTPYRMFAAIVAVVLMFVFVACGSQSSSIEPASEEPSTSAPSAVQAAPESILPELEPEPVVEAVSSTNILVAYFSREGNSLGGVDAVASASLPIGTVPQIATMVGEQTGGDMFFINTVDQYPEDYRETTDAANAELDADARPELAVHLENMDNYDIIFLGYPNWWGTIPMPVATFLEEYDFGGKTIIPFCVHEGSRLGSSVSYIESLCPDTEILEGLAVHNDDVGEAQATVQAWLADLDLVQ